MRLANRIYALVAAALSLGGLIPLLAPALAPELLGPLPGPPVLAGVLWGGALLVMLALARGLAQRLDRVAKAARRLGRGEATWRAPLGPRKRWRRAWHRDELGHLAGALDALAARQGSLARAHAALLRAAAHELRIDLDRVRSSLGAPGAGAATAAAVLTDLEAWVEDLRALGHFQPDEVRAGVDDVLVADLLAAAAAAPTQGDLKIDVESAEGLILRAHRGWLEYALRALIATARRHGARHLQLGARRTAARVELTLTASGGWAGTAAPGRLPEGVGLALAGLVAQACGGSLSVDLAPAGAEAVGDWRVVLALPAEAGPMPTRPGRRAGHLAGATPLV